MAIPSLLLVGVSFVILYVVVKILYPILKLNCRQYRLMKKLPGSPINNFILGNLNEVLTPIDEWAKKLENLLNRHGHMVRMWVPFSPLLFIGTAEHSKWFFSSKDINSKADLYQLLNDIIGQGLLISEGELWRERRKLITPAFHFSILSNFCDIFADNSLRLIQKLRDHSPDAPVDVMETMNLFTMDNMCETLMGVKIDALNNPIHELMATLKNIEHAIMKRVVTPWYWNDFLFYSVIPYGRECRKSFKTVQNFTGNIVKTKRRERAERKTNAGKKDNEDNIQERKRLAFLDLLMDASDNESVPLTDKDLMDEVNTMLLAGYDTTGTTLGFIIYQLGLHPDIQEKCYQESQRIFGDSDRKPTTADLQDMAYLSQVIKESLRLYPSGPLLCKKVTRDSKIDGYTVPEGTTVILTLPHLHRDPKHFPDPEKFDPDRFSPENSANLDPYAYAPFSAGPRNCIGQTFAKMAIKTALTYILRNFVLESVDGKEELHFIYTVTLLPSRKLETKFRPRKCGNRIS